MRERLARAEAVAADGSSNGTDALLRCVIALAACPDFDAALRCLLARAIEVGGMDGGAVYLFEGREAVLRHHVALTPDFVEQVRRRPLSLAYISAALERPREILDVVERFPEHNEIGARFGIRRVCSIVLSGGGRPFGLVNMVSFSERPPDPAALDRVRLLAVEAGSMLARFESEERLRLQAEIMANMKEGVMLVSTRDTSIVFTNPRFDELMGYGAGELLGRDAAVINAPTTRTPEQVAADIRECLVAKGAWTGFVANRRKDGSLLWCHASVSTFLHSELGPVWVNVHQDVTEARLAGEALLESDARLRFALEGAGIGLWGLDLVRGTAWRSPQHGRIFGYRSVSAPWSLDQFLNDHVHPDDRDRVGRRIRQGMASEEGWEFECRIRRADGVTRWVWVKAAIAGFAEGRPASVLGLVMDITSRHQLADRLRESQKLESVGRLAGGMAHEFNNILAATMINLGLARMEQPSPALAEHLRELETLAHRSSGLIRQLLALSRQAVVDLRSVDLAELVEAQSGALGRLLGNRIALRYTCERDLPTVLADRAGIEQILTTLALNARDAMSGGGTCSIAVSAVEADAARTAQWQEARPGRYVCVAVTDTGDGMDDEVLARLFEPFFTTKGVGEGTGLGLATVRGVVGQHHGGIEVESRVGQGSTFRVYLPVASPGEPPGPAADATSEWHGEGENRASVLLVEDEPLLRRATRQWLVRAGFAVLEAADGAEALALWRRQRDGIDVLCTDMVMPGELNGLELAEAVLAEAPDARIVLTSGYLMDPAVSERLGRTSILLVPKPAPPDQILAAIRACLAGRGAGRTV